MSDEIVTTDEWNEEDEKLAKQEFDAMAAAQAAGQAPTAEATAEKTPEELQAEADAQAAKEKEDANAKAEAEAAGGDATVQETEEQKKARLTQEVEELQKRKRDLGGEIGGELERRARQQTAELQQALQQARAELEALKAAQRPPISEIDDKVLFDGLDAELKDTSDPVVGMTAKMTRNAMRHLEQKLAEENARREQALQQQIAQSHADRFTDSVESMETGFRSVNGYDGKPPSAEWSEYLDRRRPGMAITWRQYVSMSEAPTEAAAEAFKAFKSKVAAAQPVVKKPLADASAQLAPQRSTVSPRVESKGAVSMEDQLDQIQKDYDADKITEEEFEKRSGPLLKRMGLKPG